jgi:hypothetical protein
LDEALAVGRYGDVSVFVARIAALHKPDGGPAVGQQTNEADEATVCVQQP